MNMFSMFLKLYDRYPFERLLKLHDYMLFRKTKKSISHSGAHAIRNEFRDMQYILFGKKNITLIDGGANVGLFSTYFKMYFPDSTIHAFEPQKLIQLDNVANRYKNIYVYNVALGSENGILKLHIFGSSTEIASAFRRGSRQSHKIIDVPMITLDSWTNKNNVNNIDILKLDLEGYDYNALIGARKLLKNTKIVFCECNFDKPFIEKNVSFCDFNNLLNEYGFKFFNFYGLATDNRGKATGGNMMFVK